MKRCWALAALIAICAGQNETSTGIELGTLPAFPLTKVHTGTIKPGKQVRFDGMRVNLNNPPDAPANDIFVVSDIELQGKAKSGKTWSVHFGSAEFDEVYRADLDGNGVQDYIVFGRTSFCCGRLLPPWTMAVLMMDKDGLPVPFYAQLWDGRGPEHVLRLGRDGRATLAIAAYDENPWDGRRGFGYSGHWVTSVYEPENLHWREFQGAAAGLTFPFVHRWTQGPEDLPDARNWTDEFRHGQLATAAIDITAAHITEAPNVSYVKLTPASGCDGFVITTAVYDQRDHRDIALPAKSGYEEGTLEQIHTDQAAVTLRGVSREPNRCSAGILWATK